MNKILITGGAGFIGSAVIRHIINDTSHSVVNVDKLTYAGNLESLKKAVKDAFISYDDEVKLAKMKLKGFTSVTDSDYDSVRELMKLKKSMKKKK